MRGKYWKRICEIPAYMFLLSPSGKRVQKMEGGNWIDQHEAQKVVDSAEDELSDLRSELAGLKTGYEAYERVNAELRAECEALRKRVDDMSPFKGAPKGGQDMKCLACGDYHYGLSGLPCPKMSGVAYSDINPEASQ